MTLLAIDQGTTSTRAVEVEANGTLRVVASIPHRQIHPRPGWVEHDPEELVASVTACLDAAGPSVAAFGLANQGESCLAWDDRTLRALTPVIVWQDARTAAECDRLRAEGAEALTLARAGLPLDPYFSASKLGWILRMVPEAQAAARSGHLCLGTTDAFFRHRLTGRFETDATTASRTSLMTLATCAWDAELCALFGVPVEALPRITPTLGPLGEAGARRHPLTASVVDQQAALRGHGCAAAGEAKVTFGTGAFLLAVAGAALPAGGGGPLPTVAWARAGEGATYALDGGVYAAAAALNWAKDLGVFTDWASISAFDAEPAIARGISFVPALSGLACPHWDRAARGTWMGLGLDTGPRDMVQAILEGVAFRTAEVVTAVDRITPLSGPISVDGGMARNPWFCQFFADATGRALSVSTEPEVTALGTAMLAAEGAGLALPPGPRGTRVDPLPQPPDWAARFAEARRLAQAYAAFG
jgi:glycerol kinase